MASITPLPDDILPDYKNELQDSSVSIPEDVQKEFASPGLIDKVRRIFIRGRVDGA